jgi:hypothetical protein
MSLPTDLQVTQTLALTRASVLEATQRVRSPKRSTRYRYTRNAIIAGSAIVALTAGALAVAQQRPDAIGQNAYCFEHPALDSPSVVIGSVDSPMNPLVNCSTEYNVPDSELSVCTLPDGIAAVFPREGRPAEGFCAALGLADWDSD